MATKKWQSAKKKLDGAKNGYSDALRHTAKAKPVVKAKTEEAIRPVSTSWLANIRGLLTGKTC